MSTMIAIIINAAICSIIVFLFTITKIRITNKINNKRNHHERSNGNRSINRPDHIKHPADYCRIRRGKENR